MDAATRLAAATVPRGLTVTGTLDAGTKVLCVARPANPLNSFTGRYGVIFARMVIW
jgi:hypothetical protein